MPGSYLQTLGRGLDVLEALRDRPLSIAELAEQVRFERSAVYRVVRTLETHGFLVRDDRSGMCRLGLKVWELGLRTDPVAEVRVAARPYVQGLVERFGETSVLAVYDAGEVLYIDRIEGTHPIGSSTQLGGRAPAHCVASGKALLAWQPTAEVERFLANGLERHTDHTITDPTALRVELEGIRHTGVAVNIGEWRADVGGVAAAIVTDGGAPIAALGLSGPADRLRDQVPEVSAALREAIGELRG